MKVCHVKRGTLLKLKSKHFHFVAVVGEIIKKRDKRFLLYVLTNTNNVVWFTRAQQKWERTATLMEFWELL